MPPQEQGQQQAKPVPRMHGQLSGVITGQLMQALGRPTTMYRVEVRHLWDNHYRANIFVGATVTSARITHSFFLTADEDGNIVGSFPDIVRNY